MAGQEVTLNSTPLPSATCWIDRLPTELLIAILVTSANISGSIKDRHYFPFCALLVCRRWRDVSIHTRELWTGLRIQIAWPPARILEYVRRSGSLPLEMHLDVTKENALFYETQGEPWREIFREIAPRVQRIHVDTPYVTLDGASPVLLKLSRSFPNVLEFSASSGREAEGEWGTPLGYWHEGLILPRLRSLRLDNCALDLWKDIVHSCANLEELHIVESRGPSIKVPLEEFLDVLRASPNLRILELGYQSILIDPTYDDTRPVVLENLEAVTLWNYEGRDLSMFFSLVQAPHLKILTIGGDPGGERPFYDPGLSLDFPSLETLTISQTPSALKIAMLFSPFARHIRLSVDHGDELVDDLRNHWSRLSSPLPLQTLTIRGVSSAALSRISRVHQLLPSLRQVVAWEKRKVWRFQGPPVKGSITELSE